MSEQPVAASETKKAITAHDVRFDRAGFDGSIPRYTCMNPECNCATLVRSRYPFLPDWNKAKEDFFSRHPCSQVKDEGFQI